MTQTPDEGDNKPLEETELNLGSNDDQGDTDTGINLDFADFSDDDAKSGAELNLGPLPTEEGEADKAEPAADQDAEKPDEPTRRPPPRRTRPSPRPWRSCTTIWWSSPVSGTWCTPIRAWRTASSRTSTIG